MRTRMSEAAPRRYFIERSACPPDCRACVEVCKYDAIDLNADGIPDGCNDAPVGDTAVTDTGRVVGKDASSCGCQSSGGGPLWLGFLATLLLVRRRG